MTTSISKYIEGLLYEYDSVVIPGLGAFVASYKPATIDYVQGLLHPPSKSLSFHENFNIDDRVLRNHLIANTEMNETDAKLAIDEFVRDTKESLNKREIIVFSNVGRLYKDYEQKLQFLQDTTNFNTNSYGLPIIQFYPILRAEENAVQEAPLPVITKTPVRTVTATNRMATWLQMAMPLFIVSTFVIFGLTIYVLNKDVPSPFGAKALPVVEKRINESPQKNLASIGGSFSKKEKAEQPVMDEDGEYETSIDTESATFGPQQKECIIIVGAFKNQEGVDERLKELFNLGYSPYTDKKFGLTRVGVQFAYSSRAEIQEALKRLRKKFDNNSWVYKPK